MSRGHVDRKELLLGRRCCLVVELGQVGVGQGVGLGAGLEAVAAVGRAVAAVGRVVGRVGRVGLAVELLFAHHDQIGRVACLTALGILLASGLQVVLASEQIGQHELVGGQQVVEHDLDR